MDPQNWRPDWIFAITTLLIRFFGIFVVLAVLQIFMQISGYLFSRFEEKSAQKTHHPPSSPVPSETPPGDKETNGQEITAAIGAALSLYESEAEVSVTFPIGGGSPPPSSTWSIIGRIAQLQSRVSKGRR